MSDEPIVKQAMTLQVAGDVLRSAYQPALQAMFSELPLLPSLPPMFGPPAPPWWEFELDRILPDADEATRARLADLIERVEDEGRDW